MSLKTEINKKLSGDCDQKTIIFEEFDRLFEINKSFISNDTSTKPIPKPSTSKKSSSNEILQKNCDNQKSAPICQAISLPAGKDHKIGNFNIYNKCIFFVNNDDNQLKKASIKSTNVISHKHSAAEQKTYSKLVTDKNASKTSKTDQNESLLTNNNDIKNPSETNKCLELYTAIDNELKRIEAPLGSSGVYKKVPMNGEEVFDAKPIEGKSNVYYSSTESQGKIIPNHVFKDTYVLLDNDKDAPLASKLSVDENNFNVVLTDKSSAKDSLNILAYDILKLSNSDDFVIDRNNQEIIFREPKLNKKTIYRVIKPESLGLTKKIFDSIDPEPVKSEVNVQSLLKPTVLNKKRGRPRKLEVKEATTDQMHTNLTESKNHTPLNINPMPVITTRFGRTTKRPIYIPTLSPVKNVSKELGNQRLLQSIVVDLKDPDYKLNKPLPIPVQEQSPKIDEPPIKRERNLPSEYVCSTCNKVFLGRRMQRHYISHPDHQKQTSEASSQSSTSEDSLYKFLLKKVNQVSESNDKKVEVFLKEISDFVSQLQSRVSSLVYNTSGTNMHYINTQTSKVLGVTPGHYALDLDVLNSVSEITIHSEDPIHSLAPPQPRLDYNLSMSLDDTLTLTETKLNPSEESLLRTVDDLVKEGIKKLTANHCDSSMDNNHHQHTINPQVIHYDHASDNAVEAVSMKETPPPILDLSLDLFQFNSN